METNLSNVIDITSGVAKYDASVKEVLADKQVLLNRKMYMVGRRNYNILIKYRELSYALEEEKML